LHRVELADGRAVRAFDVVGEDLELGLALAVAPRSSSMALTDCSASVCCAPRATSTSRRRLRIAFALELVGELGAARADDPAPRQHVDAVGLT
jgi:hypothetical protein